MAEIDLTVLLSYPTREELQCLISQIYQTGITADEEKAMQFLIKGAEDNNPKAQYLLGKKHAEKKELEEAEKWFRRSADNDYSDAQYEMADYDDRVKWLTILANKGDFRGIYEMATYGYTFDLSSEVRLKYLNMYLEKFPDQNYGLIHQYFADLYLRSTEINHEQAFDHLTKALALVKQNKYCRPEDFNNDYEKDEVLAELYEMLGDVYFHGYGTGLEFLTAHDYYLEATNLCDSNGHSFFQLYQMYKDGLGVEIDTEQAEMYLEQSAEADDENGQYHWALSAIQEPLLQRYWYTKDCNEIEKAQAESLIQQIIDSLTSASDEDHVDACIRLAWIYWGINYEKSYDWLLKAKSLTNDDERADINLYLGIIYKNDFFMAKDYEKAIECFEIFLSKYEGEDLLVKYTVCAYKDILKNFNYDFDEVEKDYAKASRCCQILVKYDNIKALFVLSGLLWEGLGVEKNQNEAFKLYVKAITHDKDDELSWLREKLKNIETQMLMTKMKQFEDEHQEVISMREEMQKTKTEYEQLKEQLSGLKKMVDIMKEKQDGNGVVLKN